MSEFVKGLNKDANDVQYRGNAFLRLMGYLRPHIRTVLICFVLVAALTALELYRPLLIGEAIDRYILTIGAGDNPLTPDERFSGILRTAGIYMLVLLAVGAVQYAQVCSQYQDMMDHVVATQNRNVELNQKYEEGYNLADIEQQALALGMIPASEATVIHVGKVEVPQREPEMTFWEEFRWLVEGLFA